MLTPRLSRRRQQGLSLVELMVGLTVGLIIIAATGTMYIATVRGGKDTLNSARLNIELRGAMDVMVAEIRRAGASPAGGVSDPFMQTTTDVAVHSSGSCLVFSYDRDWNSATANSDFIGFKVSDGAIAMSMSGTTTTASCPTTGWEPLTDYRVATIAPISSTPYFAINYRCMNSRTNATATGRCQAGNTVFDAANSAVAGSAVDLIESREVALNFNGTLVSDTTMRMNQSQNVLLRNHRVVTVGTP